MNMKNFLSIILLLQLTACSYLAKHPEFVKDIENAAEEEIANSKEKPKSLDEKSSKSAEIAPNIVPK